MSYSSICPLWSGFSYFDHQLQSIQWMLDKEQHGTLVDISVMEPAIMLYGGFICLGMGCGKTMICAGAMKTNKKRKTLLFAPLAVISTWIDVLLRSQFNVFVVKKDKWSIVEGSSLNPLRPSVYIANYEKLLHSKWLFINNDSSWDRVILDESHKIRNYLGKIAKRARKIVAPLRWCVTGTPLVNNYKDVSSQMAFLGIPCKNTWNTSYLRHIRQIMIHQTLDSLRGKIADAPPLPDIEEQILPFDNISEKEFYRAIQGQIKEHLRLHYHRDNTAHKLVMLMRLRQISVHPQVYIRAKRREDEDYDRFDWLLPSTKMNTIRQIIEEEKLTGDHKYLIFCQFRDEIDLLQKYLLESGVVDGIEVYHGGLSNKQRVDTLDRAKSSSCQVFLCQLAAAGVGLNLQEFDRCIFISPWWTGAMIDQAVARTVRMGQTKVVRVIHLKLAEEKTLNIDRFIMTKAERKRRDLQTLFMSLVNQ